MSRVTQYALFFAIVLGVTFGTHYYVWARLVRDTGLPWRRGATWLVIGLGASLPLALIVARALPPAIARWVALPVWVWMGLLFLLVTLLGATELVRLFWTGALAERLRGAPIDPARRLFVSRLLGGAVGLGAAGVGAFAVSNALGRVRVKELLIPLRRLPPSLDGLTIAQLTDLHIGPTLGRAWLEDVVARTNALGADVVAITGDLVDGSVERLGHTISVLGELRARYGVYFVTGNHEYYSGALEWCAELERLGVKVLRNERVSIGDGADSFDLAGIDDYNAGGLAPGHGPDLTGALAGRDAARELVLLAHQPRAIHEAAEHGVGLQLSGHTHGGQIWPWKYLVYLQQPFVEGLARVKDTQLYVSNGTGFWGPPMRFRSPAEITRVVLKKG
jgi:uncharacterized protein